MDVSRRLLLTGSTGLIIASPAIVKASNLMQITGELMDPWVIAFEIARTKEGIALHSESQYDRRNDVYGNGFHNLGKEQLAVLHKMNIKQRIAYLNSRVPVAPYYPVRSSEIAQFYRFDKTTVFPDTKP